jgi:hypothetical protein
MNGTEDKFNFESSCDLMLTSLDAAKFEFELERFPTLFAMG